MVFKSKVQPLCRYCGKPIAKRTDTKYLVTDPASMKYVPESKFLVAKLPQTKTEAQTLFNQRIASVQRFMRYDSRTDTAIDRGIDRVTLWDGESYQDEFFCSGNHAQRFAYAAARSGYAMTSWRDANKKQKDTDHDLSNPTLPRPLRLQDRT